MVRVIEFRQVIHGGGVVTARPVAADGFQSVYRDPSTGRLYNGRGDAPEPVEELPEHKWLLVHSRKVSMMREQAEREGAEIVETVDEHTGGEVVTVRVPLSASVNTEAAVQLPDSDVTGTVADFSGVDT